MAASWQAVSQRDALTFGMSSSLYVQGVSLRFGSGKMGVFIQCHKFHDHFQSGQYWIFL